MANRIEETIKQDDYTQLRSLVENLNPIDLEQSLLKSCDLGAINCVAILLEMGVDKDCVDNFRLTPVMRACILGSPDIVNLLVTWGCEINALGGPNANSPLHMAAMAGHMDICHILIEAHANVNARNEREDTPLIVAAAGGHLDVVKLLFKNHASINRRGYLECSALHMATEMEHIDVCSYLISAGASLEDEDTYGNTPLVCAAEKGCVKLLLMYLGQGAEVNRVSHSGTTALHYAAKHGWTDCCKLLLQHGAEIDAQDIRRFTPLMMACLECRTDVLRIMLSARCNVNMAAYNRRTALHYASEQGFKSGCELLLEAGACLESVDTDKCSPAMVAAHKGSVETLQFLLDRGARTTGCSRQGLSILHLAAESGSISCCDLLIDHGVNKNIRCCDGVTPLVSAIRSHRVLCAHHLIERGCSLTQRSGDMIAPLGEAVYRDIDPRLIHRLLVEGANPNTVDRFHTLPLWHAVHNLNFIVVKMLLQANSYYWRQTESMLYVCSPCSPVTHALHQESPTLVRWMLAAYAEEAAKILRAAITDRNSTGLPSSETALLVQDLTSSPQPLLRLCRRAVRRQLDTGFCVQRKISSLRLPALLHSYLLFSDLDLPREAKGESDEPMS